MKPEDVLKPKSKGEIESALRELGYKKYRKMVNKEFCLIVRFMCDLDHPRKVGKIIKRGYKEGKLPKDVALECYEYYENTCSV